MATYYTWERRETMISLFNKRTLQIGCLRFYSCSDFVSDFPLRIYAKMYAHDNGFVT